MASDVRRFVTAALASGDVRGATPLTQVRGIGTYLAERLRRALRRPVPLTVDALWRFARPRQLPGLVSLLKRALQNERANQCVSTRVSNSDRRVYHTGDVNEHGFAAVAALINYDRQANGIAGRLPLQLPVRASGARKCGCHTSAQACRAAAECALADDGITCVPRAHNARGFEGVLRFTDQSEARASLQRVRRASRARLQSSAHRRDPDARADARNGHARQLQYARKGQRLWRRSGARIRAPL